MFKKTVSYTDYNGLERTEDFYFNLNKIELAEIEYTAVPGASLTDSIATLIDSKDFATILSTIKKIILLAYGEKSMDGKRFIKNDEIRNAFEQSPAFEEIYWEMISVPDKAAEFISGIIPSQMRNQLDEAKASGTYKTFV